MNADDLFGEAVVRYLAKCNDGDYLAYERRELESLLGYELDAVQYADWLTRHSLRTSGKEHIQLRLQKDAV